MSTHDSLTPFILLGKMQHFTDKKNPQKLKGELKLKYPNKPTRKLKGKPLNKMDQVK